MLTVDSSSKARETKKRSDDDDDQASDLVIGGDRCSPDALLLEAKSDGALCGARNEA
jgi:hypothetical protein